MKPVTTGTLGWLFLTVMFGTMIPAFASQARAQGDARASDDAKAVERVLRAYEEAWSRHDAAAIAGFYHEPAMRVSPAGPIVRETRAAQQVFFAGLLSKLIQDGYAKTEWERLRVHLLDPRTAIASGVTVRRREDGSVFERQGVTYALWKTDQGWKIFLSVTHPEAAAISLGPARRK
jgi:uncharacterized protein (TIGR02246 family)